MFHTFPKFHQPLSTLRRHRWGRPVGLGLCAIVIMAILVPTTMAIRREVAPNQAWQHRQLAESRRQEEVQAIAATGDRALQFAYMQKTVTQWDPRCFVRATLAFLLSLDEPSGFDQYVMALWKCAFPGINPGPSPTPTPVITPMPTPSAEELAQQEVELTTESLVAAIVSDRSHDLHGLMSQQLTEVFDADSVAQGILDSKIVSLEPIDHPKISGEWSQQGMIAHFEDGLSREYVLVMHLENGEWRLFGTIEENL